VIDEQSSQLRYIYNKRLRKGETLSGRMEMQIRIRADGSVGEARVLRSDLGDSRFENAIAKRVMTWRFKPVPDSLGDLTVNYPFEFTRKE
jgi:TonB family protein